MITWRNIPIEALTDTQLRMALRDAIDHLSRQPSFTASNQLVTPLAAGFVAGAVCSTFALTVLGRLLS